MPDINLTPTTPPPKSNTSVSSDTKVKSKTSASLGSAFNINLMSEELRGRPEAIASQVGNRIAYGAIFGIVAGLLITGGVYGYTWFADQGLASTRAQIVSTNEQIAALEAQRQTFSATQTQLANVKKLIDDHSYWSNFFKGLEENTLPDVTYTLITTGSEGKLMLDAVAKDYATVGRQLLAFKDEPEFVSDAEVDAASAVLDEQGVQIGVRFSIAMTVHPEFIKKNIAIDAMPVMSVPVSASTDGVEGQDVPTTPSF